MHDDDDDGEEGNGDVHAAQEAEAEGDEDDITGAFDLNPCQFGVPASRSRCYTVSLSSFSLHFFVAISFWLGMLVWLCDIICGMSSAVCLVTCPSDPSRLEFWRALDTLVQTASTPSRNSSEGLHLQPMISWLHHRQGQGCRGSSNHWEICHLQSQSQLWIMMLTRLC